MTDFHLVISAVNIVEGGTLTVLRECLLAAKKNLSYKWKITAIVNSADLIGIPGINYIERPDIKRSWLARIRFEYYECRSLSRQLKADFWLSMHDTSPRVVTPRQAVYCHNAMCFYRMSWPEFRLDPKLYVFALLYGWLYRLNMSANDAVIVQQDWMRKEFEIQFGFRNVVVAHPVVETPRQSSVVAKKSGLNFFYPSLPRVFKNFEILLEAWAELETDPSWCGQLIVTVDGSENPYSRSLLRRFGHLSRVTFIGRLTHHEVQEIYKTTDCLIFPSKLETWGIPLTEAKQHGLAIICADLPYARETIGNYEFVSFFPSNDSSELARKIRAFSQESLLFSKTPAPVIDSPHAKNWTDLFNFLLK